jgi:hypothetical protein
LFATRLTANDFRCSPLSGARGADECEVDMSTSLLTRMLMLAAALVSLWMLVSVPANSPAAAAPAPNDSAACLRVSAGLYQQAERLQRQTRVQISREFTRVAANLDDYCNQKDFERARISIDWMETCIKNFTKPYRLGYCSRGKAYFCVIDPNSDACKG